MTFKIESLKNLTSKKQLPIIYSSIHIFYKKMLLQENAVISEFKEKYNDMVHATFYNSEFSI